MIEHLHVSGDPAADLAERLVAVLNAADAPTIAVSGGSTPRALFRQLARQYREEVSWDKVRVYQVDERCVPPDHDDSNWKMIHEELLDKLPLRAYRLAAERPGGADDYEALLRRDLPAGDHGLPAFDVILLGMGSDGHTASLFPGTQAEHETERLIVRNPVPQLSTERVTMTFPLIRAARRRWFLVTGSDKARAFQLAREGNVPAGRVGPSDWFVDPSVT